MNDIYFQGIWRMDWGLGNPNKTAALIAILMVAVWGLAYIRRWGFWPALVGFTALGICLVHTFSRGGFVALFSGLIPVLLMAPRPWPWKRIISCVAVIWIIVGVSVYLQAYERLGQGVVREDKSITNRLEIWKSAPTMMVDAPGGWGRGNSGKAYMEWYQDLSSYESYRTLVNSHLTWLVEFGWVGRFLYLAGWLTIFLINLPSQQARWLAVPFGIWLALFTGAFFSSVAESIWLWIVPALALVWALGWRIWNGIWHRAKFWFIPPCAATGCLLLVSLNQGSSIQKTSDVITVGRRSPESWVVLDEKVLGATPGRSLRRALPKLEELSLALVGNIRDLPSHQLNYVIVAGGIFPDDRKEAAKRLKNARSITFVNPTFFPQEILVPEEVDLHILIGEFSQSIAAKFWKDHALSRMLAGTGDFIPDWPNAVFAFHD